MRRQVHRCAALPHTAYDNDNEGGGDSGCLTADRPHDGGDGDDSGASAVLGGLPGRRPRLEVTGAPGAEISDVLASVWNRRFGL